VYDHPVEKGCTQTINDVQKPVQKSLSESSESLMMMMMMMMMMINFINVSRPHSLGKSHTNLGTQLIDIKNM